MLAWFQRSKGTVIGWLRLRRGAANTDSPERAQAHLNLGSSIDEHQRSPTIPSTEESDENSKIKEVEESQKQGTAIFYDDSSAQSGSGATKQDTKDNMEVGDDSGEHTNQESATVIESSLLLGKHETNETVSHNEEINKETLNTSISVPADATASVGTGLASDYDDTKNNTKDVVDEINDILEKPNEGLTEAVGDVENINVTTDNNFCEMGTVLIETRTEICDGVDNVVHQQVNDYEVVGEVNNISEMTQNAKFADEAVNVVDPIKTDTKETVVESGNVLGQDTPEECDKEVGTVVQEQYNATGNAVSNAYDEAEVTKFDEEHDSINIVQTTINDNVDMDIASAVVEETGPEKLPVGVDNVVEQQDNAAKDVGCTLNNAFEAKVTEFGNEQNNCIIEKTITETVDEGMASHVVGKTAPAEFGEGMNKILEQQDKYIENIVTVDNAFEETKVTIFDDEQVNGNSMETKINAIIDVGAASNVVEEVVPAEDGEGVDNIMLQQNNATKVVGDVNNASEESKIPECIDEHLRDNEDTTIITADAGERGAVCVLEETAPSENCEGVDNVVQQLNNGIGIVAKNNSFDEKEVAKSDEKINDNIVYPTIAATEVGMSVQGNDLKEKYTAKFDDEFGNAMQQQINASEETAPEIDNLTKETNKSDSVANPTNIVEQDGFDVDASIKPPHGKGRNTDAVINTNDAAADGLNLTEHLQNTKQDDQLISFDSEANIHIKTSDATEFDLIENDNVPDSGITHKNVTIDFATNVSTEISNTSNTTSDGKAEIALDAWSSNADSSVADPQTVSNDKTDIALDAWSSNADSALADPHTVSDDNPDIALDASSSNADSAVADPHTVSDGKLAIALDAWSSNTDSALVDPQTVSGGKPDIALDAWRSNADSAVADPQTVSERKPDIALDAWSSNADSAVADPQTVSDGKPDIASDAWPSNADFAVADPQTVSDGKPDIALDAWCSNADSAVADPQTVSDGKPDIALDAWSSKADSAVADPQTVSDGKPDIASGAWPSNADSAVASPQTVSDGKPDIALDAWSSNGDSAVSETQTVSVSSNNSPNEGECKSYETGMPSDDPFGSQENDSGTNQVGTTDFLSETCHNLKKREVADIQICGKSNKTFTPSEEVSLFCAQQEVGGLKNDSEHASPVNAPEECANVIGKDDVETKAGSEVSDFKPDLDENVSCSLKESVHVANDETEVLNDLTINGKSTADVINSHQNGLQAEMETFIEIGTTQPEIEADTALTNTTATTDAVTLMPANSIKNDVLDSEHLEESFKVQHGTGLFGPVETPSKFSDVVEKAEVDFQETEVDAKRLNGGLKEGVLEDILQNNESVVSLSE